MLLFVYGDDHLRVKERADDLKQKFLEKYDPTGMNVDEFVVGTKADLEPGPIMQAVQASPFLSEKRLVVIHNLVEAITKAESKPWIEGFTRTPESSVVIFLDDLAPEAFDKKELGKTLSTLPNVHTYPLPRLAGAELVAWARERVVKLGLVMAPSILDEILRRTKDDAWRTDAELHKLSAYAGKESVTMEMVDLLVRTDYEADIFGFMDALASPVPRKALEKLFAERKAGAEDFQLFGMLLRQVRLLLQARAVLDEKPTAQKQDIATSLSVHPFVAQKLLGEVRAWTMADLTKTHELAQKLDLGMKSGIKSDISVDRLVSEWLI
ncbi:MAG: DNA polymerase III subunit delta [Patescibacteria group bacterium]